MKKPPIHKQCGCGKVWTAIPDNVQLFGPKPGTDSADFWSGDALCGWYWECDCQSTLFVPLKPVERR